MESNYGNRRVTYDARRSRRAKYIRKVRLKKAGALAILILMFLAACGVIFGIGFGIYKLVTSHKMVEEPYSLENSSNIVLVENVYTGMDDGVAGTEDDYDPISMLDEASSRNTDGTQSVTGNDNNDGNADAASQNTVKKLVVVDAGHGGKDGGAVGVDNLLEKDCNLSISLFVRDKLVKKGYEVYMSRSDDTFIPLNTRASKANELGADAFVSVHMNSFPEVNTVSGIEAWTYKREGCEELGQLLVDKVSEATGSRNRGVSFAKNLVVTSKTTMPAVIIECGYITNPEEGAKLATDEYREKIADAIVEAVEAFFAQREKAEEAEPETSENGDDPGDAGNGG